jgi:hypothetical protein
MAKKYDKYGNAFHNPPYTEEEQMEMYRRMNGLVAFTRPEPKPTLSQTQKLIRSAPSNSSS